MSRHQILMQPKYRVWSKVVSARDNLRILLECVKGENKTEAAAVIRVVGQDVKALHAAVNEWIKENESCKQKTS